MSLIVILLIHLFVSYSVMVKVVQIEGTMKIVWSNGILWTHVHYQENFNLLMGPENKDHELSISNSKIYSLKDYHTLKLCSQFFNSKMCFFMK